LDGQFQTIMWKAELQPCIICTYQLTLFSVFYANDTLFFLVEVYLYLWGQVSWHSWEHSKPPRSAKVNFLKPRANSKKMMCEYKTLYEKRG